MSSVLFREMSKLYRDHSISGANCCAAAEFIFALERSPMSLVRGVCVC